ncbi:MAG TPA: acyl-CoA thioesterase [Dictyobacter sp.]|jgi:acyl-CoA hydrolase|nr:acyl-CoA thioesterase [Dictyobacter sp.]
MTPFDKIFARYTTFPDVDLTQGRCIAYSKSTTCRIMELMDGNSQGNVHGGVIMRMVDEAAAIVALKHSQRPVVTARVERFNFLAPAFIGDVVSVNCELQYVGRTSMEVGVEVVAEDPITGEIRMIASSYLTFVALDEHRKPTPVPPLVPQNEEEAAIIERARVRRMHQQKVDEELAKMESDSPQK